MVRMNEHYLKLPGSYLFSEIASRVQQFTVAHPEKKVIRLGIGDVTRPLPSAVIGAMHTAVDEMANGDTFRGYGPEQGYAFLRESIVQQDYGKRGIHISADEIFVSDGSKCDTANIQELFDTASKVAVTDPVYPVYVDTNVMAGRTGNLLEDGRFEHLVYLPCNQENGFIPECPKERVDLIYLCFPNNPTGTTLNKEQLKVWVDYARQNGSIILFDSAYEAFITEEDVPHSIYEIEGAKEVAIEFRSYSKTAGFTGTRCAYTVVPKEVRVFFENEKPMSLQKLWLRRQTTKFNGVSYIIQKAAEAIYTKEGQTQVAETIAHYMNNAKLIKKGLDRMGLEAYGGVNAPYIWLKTPNGLSSWAFFDKLLHEAAVVGTPGDGFGPSGRGYFRLTAFGSHEATMEAMERIESQLKL